MTIYRLIPFLIAGICTVSTVRAAGAAELPQELIDCRNISSAVARLDCYDRTIDLQQESAPAQASGAAIAQSSESGPAKPAAAAATAPVSQPSSDISPEALFGKNQVELQETVQKATGTEDIDEINSFVSKIRASASGKAIIYLDNGQIWTQIDNSRLRLSDFDKVTIRRASLGSFMLRKSGSKTAMRVKRIS